MESIIIESTDETPKVTLDKTKGIFQLEGRSLPEDVTTFYDPIISWIKTYTEEPLANTEFVFKMEYFNTASSKMILDILLALEEIKETGNAVKIKWYYRQDDEDMEEAGEEYAEIIEIPFENIPY
jgi:hypothetical protein